MIRIELNSVGNEIKTEITVEGKGSNVVDEIVCFHKKHFDMMKGLLDKLSSPLEAKVLIKLIEDHFDVEEGDEEK